MVSTMRCEISRMVSARGFIAALLLGVIGILAGIDWAIPDGAAQAGSFLALYQGALCSKTVCYLVPVAAVLPWSDSFLAEYQGGFLKSSLPRMGRRGYVENKIIAVALSGCLVWLLAGVLALFFVFLLFFPMEQQGTFAMAAAWQLLEVLLRIGLLGAIFASLGGICGVLGGSAYLAFGFPFVGYYFCIILPERYFPDALWLYPPQWITGAARWGEQGEGLWLFLLLFLGVAVAVHGAVLYGKVEEI